MNNKQKLNHIPFMQNMQHIDLQNKKERVGKQNFKSSVLKNSASVLASKLAEHIKKGGDINNLTPNDVFKKNGN